MGNEECRGAECLSIENKEPVEVVTYSPSIYQSLSRETIELALQLCKESKVIESMSGKLLNLVYSDDQLDRLASVAVDFLVKKETERESKKERAVIQKILSDSNIITKLKNKSLGDDTYYDSHSLDQATTLYEPDIVEMAKKELRQLSQGALSRIRHSVAKIKILQFTSCCDGEYRYRQVDDIDEMVRLEERATLSRKAGQQNSILLEQIQQQTRNLLEMLTKTDFRERKYELNKEEVLLVARTARQASQISHDGVFILITYLQKSMFILQKQGKSPNQIEGKMKIAVEQLIKKYPPGEGLKSDDKGVEEALEKLEIKGDNKGKFSHQPTPLSGSSKERSEKVRQSILHYAEVAKKYQHLFEQMIRKTCLKLALSTLTGLKLNPSKPNQKAVLRIVEKIFFKSAKYAGHSPKDSDKLIAILKDEEIAYQKELGSLLEKKKDVTFTVSDMVRGKCTFSSVNDIIQVVRDIRQYCQENSGYRIIEIESRFGLKVPISDVTMKIVLGEEIVAELQLTLQTNAAAYHFAHIVYEVSRSKIFSKCKMVDNMFSENEQRMNQLIGRTMLLSDSTVPFHKYEIIRQAFSVQNKRIKTWQEAIGYAIEAHPKFKNNASSRNVFQEGAEQLMLAVINLQHRQLTKAQLRGIVRRALAPESGLSGLAQTVCMQEVFYRIDLGIDLKLNYFVSFKQYVRDLLGLQWSRFLKICEKSCMLECYIGELSTLENYHLDQIDNAWTKLAQSCLSGQLLLTDFQIKLLQEIVDAMSYKGTSSSEAYSSHLYVRLERSIMRHQYAHLVPKAKLRCYQGFVLHQMETNQKLVSLFNELRQLLIHDEALLVEWELWNTAIHLMACSNKDEAIFKQYQQNYKKVAQLSSLTFVSLATVQNCNAHWLIAKRLQAIKDSLKDKQAIEEACRQHYSNILACDLTPLMAMKYDLKHMLQHCKKSDWIKVNQQATYLSPIRQFQPSQIESAVLVSWKNLQTLKLRNDSADCFIELEGWKMIAKANWPGIKTVDFSTIKAIQVIMVSKTQDVSNQSRRSGLCWKLYLQVSILIGRKLFNHTRWMRISEWKQVDRTISVANEQSYLQTDGNSVGDQGCKWLSKANWPQLKQLHLSSITMQEGSNSIGDKGCVQLSKASWSLLSHLGIGRNTFQSKGYQALSQANWPKLGHLQLIDTPTVQKGCEWISKAHWPSMQTLLLELSRLQGNNWQTLAGAYWNNLKTLKVGSSYQKIEQCCLGSKGCEWVSKAKWPNLEQVDLKANQIDAEACKWLGKTVWIWLRTLQLGYNNLNNGCIWLCKAQWPRLQQLGLQEAHIDHSDCYWLRKASFPGLITVNLDVNQVQDKGCEWLSQAAWPKLETIYLCKNQVGNEGVRWLSKASWPKLYAIISDQNPMELNRQVVTRLFGREILIGTMRGDGTWCPCYQY